ncbi:YitT family protein [Haloplasma contractile]|uniref:DUF2179 domain-containing protein n=1 Tax=Haloplasma contractile SSD-17B TaxID=1033810 RepID=U2DSA5_9MOLU|nr:YitT family protein [Haloplasma contractile]ERJ11422.1 hypothetical protein HLPCO_002544 [Haloplasma contractile SSD-17B]
MADATVVLENKKLSKKKIWDFFKSYSILTIGCYIMAVAFNVFLNKYDFVPGGVTGLSTVIEKLFHIKPAYSQWVMNLPLFFLGWIVLGNEVAVKSIYGTIMLPAFVLITEDYVVVLENEQLAPLLAAVFGGVGIGLGLGLIFRANGSTGGLDIPAQILHKYSSLTLGVSIAVFDVVVITTGLVFFGVEKGLLALISLYTTTKAIDLVQMGPHKKVAVYIVSQKYREFKDLIINKVDEDASILNVSGGYNGINRNLLVCLMDSREVPVLKSYINEIDNRALLFMTNASEIDGEQYEEERSRINTRFLKRFKRQKKKLNAQHMSHSKRNDTNLW